MRLLRSRIFLALVGVALLCAGIMALRYEAQRRDLMALHATFNGSAAVWCTEPPPWMPAFLDRAIHDLILRIEKDEYVTFTRMSRLRRACGGRLDRVDIYPNEVTGDVDTTLRRFPHLRSLYVGGGSELVESDIVRMCTTLRALRDLKLIQFQGIPAFSDACLAPLGGHPEIRSLSLEDCALTRRSIPTLSSLPLLRQLTFIGVGSSRLPAEEIDAIEAALAPRVIVERYEK